MGVIQVHHVETELGPSPPPRPPNFTLVHGTVTKLCALACVSINLLTVYFKKRRVSEKIT